MLFLVFNRPGHTAAALDRLREIAPPKLYIHADGPRTDRAGEAEKVAAVRAELEKIDWLCEVKTLFRDTNMGLREGVFDALNWFFGQEAHGIVLEDDCVPDVSFFHFCEATLREYADDEQVMHICGSNLAEAATCGLAASFVFSKFALVWGWASWRRAWQKMSLDLDGLEVFLETETWRAFLPDVQARTYMADKFWTTKRRENQSWAYAWQYSVLKNNGLCLLPKVNLVENVGIGAADATNTTGKNPKAALRAGHLETPFLRPGGRARDLDLEQRVFYAYQKSRSKLWRWFWLKKLGLR